MNENVNFLLTDSKNNAKVNTTDNTTLKTEVNIMFKKIATFMMIATLGMTGTAKTVNNFDPVELALLEKVEHEAVEEMTLNSHCNGLYAEIGLVTEIDKDEDLVYFTCQNGNVFAFTGVEDFCYNDLVSAIMDDNGTPEVYDDIIINIRYGGYISDEEALIWIK